MSEFEVFIANEESQYGEGIVLNKYGDKYSLVSARKSTKGDTSGQVFLEWCFPQDRDRKPKAKTIPLGIRLGNRTQAVSTLLQLAAALGGKPTAGKPDQTMTRVPADDPDSIPF